MGGIMIYTGIDIANKFNVCCIIDENKKKLRSFSFSNDSNGFTKFRILVLKYERKKTFV